MAGEWKPKKVRKDKPSDSPKNYLNPFKTPLAKAKPKSKRNSKKA